MSAHSRAAAVTSGYGREDWGTTGFGPGRSRSGILPGSDGETPDLPVIDGAVVAALVSLSGDMPGFMDEMVGDFEDSVQRHTSAMRRAVLHADTEGLIFAAHSLRGSCGIIGAQRMAALSGQIEENAHAGGSRTLPLIIRLKMEFKAVRVALDQAISAAASSLPR